jgi:hypothetical protein
MMLYHISSPAARYWQQSSLAALLIKHEILGLQHDASRKGY